MRTLLRTVFEITMRNLAALFIACGLLMPSSASAYFYSGNDLTPNCTARTGLMQFASATLWECWTACILGGHGHAFHRRQREVNSQQWL